jgi:catechol 2,3-dioxygenase-like lactoylglutathione lyase family enzyme
VIHHVAFEVSRGGADAEVAFWRMLGFAEVVPPGTLAERARWVECDGVQVHLLSSDAPVAGGEGHVALAVRDYDEVVARLRDAGHEAAPRAEHFGAARTQVRTPAGHLVEVMAPPG